jgi:threonine dehydratase
VSEGNRVDQLLEAIHQARARVYQIGNATPLEPMVIEGVNQSIWVKREDLGPIKAYKWRGAFNAMACLTPAQLEGGVVAASAGNHAQGNCLGGSEVGNQGLYLYA